jgi:RNA polymerase sigma-70 factor (ECF subfamily)
MDTPRSNQEELFLSVIEQNKGIIYKIANSFKKDEEDKKDLVQEIIFQLWRAFSSYDGRSKFSTWMYRVALNVAISSYRKQKKKNEIVMPVSESMIAFVNDDEPNEKESNLNLLQQFISELKELDRALMLLYLEEKNGKEMAEILGLTETNIRTKINRIKERLKQRFSKINN